MRGPDRRPGWRKAIYAPRPGMTDACRVLLLYLLDHMDSNGIVSRPRSKITAELGIHSARVTERLRLARELGFLTTVRRGRQHWTAVYQATIPRSRGTAGVPLEDAQRYTSPVATEVQLTYPPEPPRGTPHRQPRTTTQVEHSSVPPVVAESATKSAAIRSTDDEPKAEVTSPRRTWEDSA